MSDIAAVLLAARAESVHRHDPENRDFLHPDPVGWTLANRGKVLRAFYTLLLGKRARASKRAETRFKEWWRLCGPAVENGARQHRALIPEDDWLDDCSPKEFSFKEEFLAQEEDEEETASLADALEAVLVKWPAPQGPTDGATFKATDLAKFLNETADPAEPTAVQRAREALHEFLFPTERRLQPVTEKATSKRLRRYLGDPVNRGVRTLTLKSTLDTHAKVLSFYVRRA